MFVWRLWCCFAVFVALFLYSLVLRVINRGCDVFFRVLLLFLCFICEIAVDNLFDIFPQKLSVLFFFVWMRFAMFLPRVCICLGCSNTIPSPSSILLVFYYFTKSALHPKRSPILKILCLKTKLRVRFFFEVVLEVVVFSPGTSFMIDGRKLCIQSK